MHYSDHEDHDGHGEEHSVDRVKDDMASRRISSHIPAPLRKKKYEDQHKKFITPSGNPVAYLQKHMRSKSLSDLNEERKEEEQHRAEINMRYDEMDKLKVMLKEEEDTWTSKLQSWKSRRRSVTEDARKRKEERVSLEKEVEIKSGRRKTKTYKQIVEDKMRRDKELAQLDDHDEYEFVSPRSSTSGTGLTSPEPISSPVPTRYSFDALRAKSTDIGDTTTAFQSDDPGFSKETESEVFFKENRANSTPTDSRVQYKYTTKVTAVINNPVKNPESQPQISTSSIAFTPAKTLHDTPKSLYNKAVFSKTEESQKKDSFSFSFRNADEVKTSAPQEQPQSRNQPKVLLRSKNPNFRRERPKSAHDLPSGSSTLPRSYCDYSTPKPFTAGATNFQQYRKTAFASRRSMWENMSVPGSQTLPASAKETQPIHTRNASDEILSSRPFQQEPIRSTARVQPVKPLEKSKNSVSEVVSGPKVSQQANMFERQQQKKTPFASEQNKSSHPPKVPLISRAQVPIRQPNTQENVLYPTTEIGMTATLSTSGLSMTSPRMNKATLEVTNPRKTEALFDDMKICINQRPRSEKGFGFTVRGGDDGKPVIVDTVSPGGAADICHLCVSDEILAINEVPLSDCKTQDDIVQLIVSSVITGNLSLNIRRYGKPKKTSPLRLSGTKVVMTPGGFVQVRSDKPAQQTMQSRAQTFPRFQKEISVPPLVCTDDNNNNKEIFDGDLDALPPPPTHEELAEIGSVERDSQGRQSPLSNLIGAASQNYHMENNGPNLSFGRESSEDSFSATALSEVHSGKNDGEDDDELRREVIEAQKALDFEQVNPYEREYEKQQLRHKLQEEQRRLEEEEIQREEARRRLQEEARLEDIKVEEELRKIKARKLKQQQERRKDMESLQKDNRASIGHTQMNKPGQRSNGYGQMQGARHWMIEEAERRRVAEMEGRKRTSAFERSGKSESNSGSALPDHVIQHLTQRTTNPTGPRPYVRNTVSYDINPKATLL